MAMTLFFCVCCLSTFFVAKVFAFTEVESATTFRGEKKSLALPKVSVYIQEDGEVNSEAAMQELTPLLRDVATVVPDKQQASLYMTISLAEGGAQVSLVEAVRPTSPTSFMLPKDGTALQKTLLGYAHSLGLRALQGSMAFPDVLWNVHMWTAAEAGESGTKNIHGEFWKPSSQISGTKNAAPYSYDGRTLVSFSFMNSSKESFYVYLFNTTDSGQIIPILAPKELRSEQNTLLPHKEHALEGIFLELSSLEENVILIIAREPLDVSHWQQEGLSTATQSFLLPHAALALENWSSRVLTFIKK